jgi:hypothetical protein
LVNDRGDRREWRHAAPVLPAKLKYRPQPPPTTITDPDLREIVLHADIRPVTDTEPGRFARQLAWELQDEPVLKDAWQRFATYDHLAVRLRDGQAEQPRWKAVKKDRGR